MKLLQFFLMLLQLVQVQSILGATLNLAATDLTYYFRAISAVWMLLRFLSRYVSLLKDLPHVEHVGVLIRNIDSYKSSMIKQ